MSNAYKIGYLAWCPGRSALQIWVGPVHLPNVPQTIPLRRHITPREACPTVHYHHWKRGLRNCPGWPYVRPESLNLPYQRALVGLWLVGDCPVE